MVVVNSMGTAAHREWEQWSGHCSRHVEVAVIVIVIKPWWSPAWALLHIGSGCHSCSCHDMVVVVCLGAAARPVGRVE